MAAVLAEQDWSAYAGHELTLDEVRNLSNVPKVWGWIDGMFQGGSDDRIALRFQAGYTYEPVTRELWRRLCKGAKLVADIGAHSGVFTLDAYRAGAEQVFAAEPHPINYARLVLNCRYNGFYYGSIFYGAIGDEDKVGSLLVKDAFHVHAAGRMDMHNANGAEFPVLAARLDTVLPRNAWGNLKVIKIDAENWTDKVLWGMAGIFANEHRPDIIIECTMPGLGAMLKPFGYRFWHIWETGKIEECEDLVPYNPGNNYNGTDEDCRNRFCSVNGLPA